MAVGLCGGCATVWQALWETAVPTCQDRCEREHNECASSCTGPSDLAGNCLTTCSMQARSCEGACFK